MAFNILPFGFIASQAAPDVFYGGSPATLYKFDLSIGASITSPGSLTVSRNQPGSFSTVNKAFYTGGYSGTHLSSMESFARKNSVSSSVFGNLTTTRFEHGGSCNGSKGIVGGGVTSAANYSAIIDQIDVASLGNATFFGNLTIARETPCSVTSKTRAFWMGGIQGLNGFSTMEYVDYATTSNATSFGNLVASRGYIGGDSNKTTAVLGGGFSGPLTNYSTLESFTLNTLVNSSSFGNLTVARASCAGAASDKICTFTAGVGAAFYTLIDYISFSSLGNASYFGDLPAGSYQNSDGATSNANGGLL
jgi:hypothetical protein